MAEIRNLICIGCPMGCPLTVTMNDNGTVVNVTGHTCKRGFIYAHKEVTDPTRIVTSTVHVIGGHLDMVPVKTAQDVPKSRIFDCIVDLKEVYVHAPVHVGDVLLENVAGTGVSVIATREIFKR